MKTIEPKVKIIDFGPNLNLEGLTITPDELVYSASAITYKDVGVFTELLELKKSGELEEKTKNSLIKSAGAGHASLSTTPGFWIYIENSSKIIDSIFTGMRFGSSLMPSGRRVPITKEQIMVPKGLEGFKELYLERSEKNIELYEKLQEQGIKKQEASKIVQYGHKGGGFMFLPLESLIYFSRIQDDLMPKEGRVIISQIEDFIKENGMSITYEARKNAPRSTIQNPNIFHERKNYAEIFREEFLFDSNDVFILNNPPNLPLNERDERIKSWIIKRKEIIESGKESILRSYKQLQKELEEIISDYNDSISLTTFTIPSWRVWGEVKRHRTLNQVTESIYNTLYRNKRIIKNIPENIPFENKKNIYSKIVSIPPSLNKEQTKEWISAFRDSLELYWDMVDNNVKKSDAVLIIPRGIKLGVIKHYDLFNLTLGYMSLRLCNTAEPEMKTITEKERELIIKYIPESVGKLISPKCNYSGFCLDRKFCENIKNINKNYNQTAHNYIHSKRKEEIEKKLK